MYAEWAAELAERLLAEALPDRWAHSREVGRRAEEIQAIAGEHADELIAAAYLHDIGYAPGLRVTGFHPLDGARYLRDETDASSLIRTLVANHTGAAFEAQERNLLTPLRREFPVASPDEDELVDAVTHCDLCVGPTGGRLRAEQRIKEILDRYPADHAVHRAVTRSRTWLLERESTVQARLNHLADSDG